LFDKLNSTGLIFQSYGTWREGKKYFKIYRDALRLFGASLPLSILVGGFWAFRKGAEIERLSKKWIENWELTGKGRDMPSLACAMQQLQIPYVAIRKEDGFFSVNINDPSIVVHRKRISDMIFLGIHGYKPYKPFDKNFHEDWRLVYNEDTADVDAVMTHPWVLKKYENSDRVLRVQRYINKYLPEILKGGINFLDIATGPGDVMEIANNAGCNSLGIEIDFPTKEKTNEHVRIKYIRIKHQQRKLDIVYSDFNAMMERGNDRINGTKFEVINCQDAINLISGVIDPLGLDDPLSTCIKKPEERLFEITRDAENLYHNDGMWRFGEKYDTYFNKFYAWCRYHLNLGGIMVLSALGAKNYKENSEKTVAIAEKNGFRLEQCDRYLTHRFKAV